MKIDKHANTQHLKKTAKKTSARGHSGFRTCQSYVPWDDQLQPTNRRGFIKHVRHTQSTALWVDPVRRLGKETWATLEVVKTITISDHLNDVKHETYTHGAIGQRRVYRAVSSFSKQRAFSPTKPRQRCFRQTASSSFACACVAVSCIEHAKNGKTI